MLYDVYNVTKHISVPCSVENTPPSCGESYKCDTGRESRQMWKSCVEVIHTEQNPKGDKTWLLCHSDTFLIICYIDTPPRHFDNILLASGNVRADRYYGIARNKDYVNLFYHFVGVPKKHRKA